MLNGKKNSQLLTKSIQDFSLTVRTYNVLRRAGISTVGDLTELSWNQLAGKRGVVRKTCEEVESMLKGMGLKLREEER